MKSDCKSAIRRFESDPGLFSILNESPVNPSDSDNPTTKNDPDADCLKLPDKQRTKDLSGCGRVVAGPRAGDGPIIRREPSGCHIWLRCVDQDGYGYFRRDGKHVRAHIHYYEEKFGAVPAGNELDHTCRNRRCCNPDHLEPVTHLENCRRGGLVTTGMTIEKAREIRRLRALGIGYGLIGEQFNISKSLVGQIVTNRCWKERVI